MKNIIGTLCCLLFFLIQSNAQCPPSAQKGIHVVQPNENLYRISIKYDVSIDQICSWNNITIDHILPRCSELIVASAVPLPSSFNHTANTNNRPSEVFNSRGTIPRTTTTSIAGYRKQKGRNHIVQPGETLAGLARLYGYTEERFREFNAFATGEITPGSSIFSSDCNCDRLSYDEPNTPGYVSAYNPQGSGTGYTPTTSTGDPYGYNPPKTQPNNTDPFASKGNSNQPNEPSTTSNPPGGKASASYMKDVELSMIDEINLMRSNPAGYVQYIEAYVHEQKTTGGFPISQSVVDELIRELRSSPKLSHLVPKRCVYTAARKHGEDNKRRGSNEHVGTDGSWPWDRVKRECSDIQDGNENLVGGPSTVRKSVIILLIDQGIPNRGHRRTLMEPKWKYVACYKTGQVGRMPNSWVQKFAY